MSYQMGSITTSRTIKKSCKRKGFTLLELMITLGILAILAGITVPRYNNIREHFRKGVDRANAKILVSAANAYFTEMESIPVGELNGVISGYVGEWPKVQLIATNNAGHDLVITNKGTTDSPKFQVTAGGDEIILTEVLGVEIDVLYK
jgi:prepilin-type N-terminal cleavage/methylation domain-containing protein